NTTCEVRRMRWFKRFRPSPAMVIACAALLLVLGGTGYAAVQALPRNSVTTVQVKDHSLLARDFRAGQLPRGAPGPAGPAGPAGPCGGGNEGRTCPTGLDTTSYVWVQTRNSSAVPSDHAFYVAVFG